MVCLFFFKTTTLETIWLYTGADGGGLVVLTYPG